MRKNQLKNRQLRKDINSHKAPVSRIEKQIHCTKTYIRRNIWFIIAFFLLTILFAGYAYTHLNKNCWKEINIIYQSHYYVPRSYSVRGASTGDYYIITDTQQRDWRVNQDLDNYAFTSDVKQGDKLTLRYHYWLVGHIVVTLESEEEVYISLDEAVKNGKSNGKAAVIISIITFASLIISVICFVKNKTEFKILSAEYRIYGGFEKIQRIHEQY